MLPSLAGCGALINSCFVLSWVPTQVMCGPTSLGICSGYPHMELCSTVCWTMQELLEVGESVLVQQEPVWHLVHVQPDRWLQTWDCWAVPSQTMECTHWRKGMIEWPDQAHESTHYARHLMNKCFCLDCSCFLHQNDVSRGTIVPGP